MRPHSPVLITGRGLSGSWAIRGDQLGREIGAYPFRWRANCAPDPTRPDARIAVWVKRPYADAIPSIRKAGCVLVWDVVDAWRQPEGNEWGEGAARHWLREAVREVQPDFIVAPTHRFHSDLRRWNIFDARKVLTLPHHAFPDYVAMGPKVHTRKEEPVLGYEGGGHYINRMRPLIVQACARAGWRFVEGQLTREVDVVLCARDSFGYPVQNWKSNVKLANAQALGLPAICSREAGYTETSSGGELYLSEQPTADDIFGMLAILSDPQLRTRLGAEAFHATPSLRDIGRTYRDWLDRID